MKFLIVSFALAAIASAQYQPGYTQPSPSGNQQIPIVHQVNEQTDKGNYHYEYQGGDGTVKGETGTLIATRGANGAESAVYDIQGEYSYTSPEGIVIRTTYTAGPGGFYAEGDHIPKTPDYILRSLEWNAAHPEESNGDYNPDYNRKTNAYYPGQPGVLPVSVYRPVLSVKPVAKDAATEAKKDVEKVEIQKPSVVPTKPSVFPVNPVFPGAFGQPGVNPAYPGYYGPQPGFPGVPGYPQPGRLFPGQTGFPQPLAYPQPGYYQGRQ